MKPVPIFDFPLVVRHQVDEHADHPTPQAFEGIYTATLNYMHSITFVPEVEGLARQWPPKLGFRLDSLDTKRRVRFEALLSGYAVAPKSGIRSSTQNVNFESGDDKWESRIRFVPRKKFLRFIEELEELSQDLDVSRLQKGVPVSRLAEYEVVRFIVDELVLGDLFSEKHRALTTTMTVSDRRRWLEGKEFRPWTLEVNDITKEGVFALLERQGLKFDRTSRGQTVAVARDRRVVASALRRGLDGKTDYMLLVLEGDRILDWREALASLAVPYRIRRADFLFLDAGYVDRTEEVAHSDEFTSPYWKRRRDVAEADHGLIQGGKYELSTHLHGFGTREIWIARDRNGEKLLATISRAPHEQALVDRLARNSPGLLEFVDLVALADGETALLERLPGGKPLAPVLRAVDERRAARLVAIIGDTLLGAAAQGIELSCARPELIWAQERDGELALTGLTDRCSIVFSEEPAECFASRPIWLRRHVPEGETGTKALAFNLALLFCQLQLGGHPIETRLFYDNVDLMPTLPNAYELLSPASAELVRAGLEPEPHDRIGLAEIVGRLRELAPVG